MYFKQCLGFLVIMAFNAIMSGQPNFQTKKEEARLFFLNEKYQEASVILQALKKEINQDPESLLMLGVSLFQINRLNEALKIFDKILETDGSTYLEPYWFKARIFHNRNEFSEAINWYKIYLKGLRSNHPHRKMVIDAIRSCSNGLNFKFKPEIAEVENLGIEVNSAYDEFAPVLSPNHPDRLYFSSIREGNLGGKRDRTGTPDEVYGNFQSDMFLCQHVGPRVWGDVQPMHHFLNSNSHDILLDFSRSGNSLFFFKGDQLGIGDIFIDTFKRIEDRSIATTLLISPIAPRRGDGMISLYNDTLFIFSSNRPGGYGGYDLYRVSQKNGIWGEVKNLGPGINSAYDEISPFLALDGITLYFSSNNPAFSIGGFDIFKAVFVTSINDWSPPFNLGLPINSAADDSHMRLARDGFSAFFCSSRKDGYGQRDLYFANFFESLEEMKYTLPPIENTAHLSSTSIKNKEPDDFPEKEAPFSPPIPKFELPVESPSSENLISGEYAQPGEINFVLDGTDLNFYNSFKIDPIISILLKNGDARLVLSTYRNCNSNKAEILFEGITFTEKIARDIIDAGIPRHRIFIRAICSENNRNSTIASFFLSPVSDFSNTPNTPSIQKISRNIGQGASPINQDVLFKIQIISLKGPYNGNLFEFYDWPMVEKAVAGDYYRYTIGAFNDFNSAQNALRQLQQNGTQDAFIVPYIMGYRADQNLIRENLDTYPELSKYLSK